MGKRGIKAGSPAALATAERMRKMHADPEFKAAHAERLRKMHADPEFKAAHAERSAERMRKMWQLAKLAFK